MDLAALRGAAPWHGLPKARRAERVGSLVTVERLLLNSGMCSGDRRVFGVLQEALVMFCRCVSAIHKLQNSPQKKGGGCLFEFLLFVFKCFGVSRLRVWAPGVSSLGEFRLSGLKVSGLAALLLGTLFQVFKPLGLTPKPYTPASARTQGWPTPGASSSQLCRSFWSPPSMRRLAGSWEGPKGRSQF